MVSEHPKPRYSEQKENGVLCFAARLRARSEIIQQS